MKIDDNLSKVFDMEPTSTEVEVITSDGHVILPEMTQDAAIDDDYNRTRNNLISLYVQGQDALQHALEVAKSSEHPRAFEVVGGLMKNLSDINLQLLELHEKKQKLDQKSGKNQQNDAQTVTNNAVFVGSTSELSIMLKKLNLGE